MTRVRPYEVVLPVSGMVVFNSLKKRDRQALLDFFNELAGKPSIETDWVVYDDTDRPNFRHVVGQFLITFWADHSAREVRIVRIDRVD